MNLAADLGGNFIVIDVTVKAGANEKTLLWKHFVSMLLTIKLG